MKTPTINTGTFRLALILIALVSTFQSNAQVGNRRELYRGMEASMGVKSGTIKSNIPQLNHLHVATIGGSAGYVFGNPILITRVGAGFFYSADCTSQTIDLFTAHALVNIYPLDMIYELDRKFVPYLVTGLSYNRDKFAGNYLNTDPHKSNYSLSDDEYFGKVDQISLNYGAGVEWRISTAEQFFYLFSECRSGLSMYKSATISELDETQQRNRVTINIGFRIGLSSR